VVGVALNIELVKVGGREQEVLEIKRLSGEAQIFSLGEYDNDLVPMTSYGQDPRQALAIRAH